MSTGLDEVAMSLPQLTRYKTLNDLGPWEI